MIGCKEWFERRWFGWGLTPVTWQGWVYVLVAMAGLFFFAFQKILPIAAETSYKLCLIWLALFLLDTVVMSFEYGVCKPAVTVFLTACDQLRTRPERTLMVGDNPLTDSGAVAAGMHVLLLPPPAPTGPRGLDPILSLA